MRPVSNEFPVSQEFGSDATAGVTGDPNGSEVQQLVAAYGNYQPYGHAGQDIACPIGTPVHAIADGTVIWADWGTNLPGDATDAGYRQRWYLYKNFPGIVTLIQHDGWISMYGHLSSNDAAPVGTVVTEGQLIGLSGNTKAPGVTLGAHLHVGALVDLTYSCANGYIYGCVDPSPYYGTISPQSATVTPIQEDDLTPEQAAQLAYIAGPQFKADIFAGASDIERGARASFHTEALNTEVEWYGFDGQTQPAGQRHTTSQALALGWADATSTSLARLLNSVPANVLNQQFTLPDGTTTNLAGLLAQINAKPAAVTNVTNAPAVDVDALVARLKAELPAAQFEYFKTQITK
ncbi:M23 family metallopeptidase [Arthrobacter liuii]|uniref:M23ase beta-sheet core domain-containing protein n=1 Tax=Arthrobacter liuii TaxID=1476996 RepID=A0ABQ2AP90_9MICC|nr:M23 family metallopeptidase [Arthrobacter liuii]GGH93697.1 hypothetical protein GCM10007170_15170 [Arthrobacter liuii]